ncbi:hypothetical protein, partial [Streptomyces bottropensis]|uniref:hypothetical protein n=1 Tax=Streptomyces bottropensis TaxID=42235 RepID=UPI00367BBCBB
SCLRVTTDFLPDPPSTRIRIGKVDHDITQALAPVGPERAVRIGDEMTVRITEVDVPMRRIRLARAGTGD